MLQALRRVVYRMAPHEHEWITQNLGGGLERSVCKRCGQIGVKDLPRNWDPRQGHEDR
ncbi:MAG: hypothetical protein OEM97_00315 [Acidimicrobiia bacterium]|nr:hypothetical protein [Acidimicrobiia bacterium]